MSSLTRTRHELTPKQAVLKFCRQCVARAEVRNCGGEKVINSINTIGGVLTLTTKECVFYRYRLGEGRPKVKQIRETCLYCMGGSRSGVRECQTKSCPLYPFRMGRNPNRSTSTQATSSNFKGLSR